MNLYTTKVKLILIISFFLLINNIILSQEDVIQKENTIPNIIPSGFVIKEAFPSGGFSYPVQLVFLPDGRKLVANKAGIVWLVDKDGYKKSTPFADLKKHVLNNTDKGLLSIAIDPDYEFNKWVYFLYTVDPDSDDDDNDYEEAWGRVERYKVNNFNQDVIDKSTKQILLGNGWQDGIPFSATDGSHAVGCLRFGEDNSLLVSAGDGANWDQLDPGGLNPSAFSDNKLNSDEDMGAFRSQSLNSLSGKILRLNKETGEGLSTNPFYDNDPASTRSKIWAYGLRNPFRFIIKPGSGSGDFAFPGVIYISDVGWGSFEELNIAKKGGENFGWPRKEGIEETGYADYTSTYNGNINVINPGNYENPSDYEDPVYWWSHCCNGEDSNPVGWVGSCSIVGDFYTGSAYPSEYKDNLFLMDYGNRWVKALEIDSDNNINNYTNFIDGAPSGPTSIEADPVTGDLYLVIIGNSSIWKITYPSGNYNPVINADINPIFGNSPLNITFDASESFDPDTNDILSYHWDFGDGFSSNSPVANHVYFFRGEYDVTLTVTDNNGGSDIKTFKVYPGKKLPDAVIKSYKDTSFFNIGETLILEAEKFSGSPDYIWEFDFIHNDHIHPAQYTYTGRKIEFYITIPHGESGEHYHWRSRLTVTESNISNYDTVDFFPKVNLKTDSIWFTPINPVFGEDFSANIKVENIGEVSTISSNYNILKGIKKFSGNIIPINSNEDVVLNIPLGEMDSLIYDIEFFADSDDKIFETDESDNIITKTIEASIATRGEAYAEKNMPTEFQLDQNYPNPFNPETIISYAVPFQERVSLEVYNILGDKIATLVNEEKPAGFHKVKFAANNLNSGKNLASGVYFYIIKAGKFKKAKKLLFIK